MPRLWFSAAGGPAEGGTVGVGRIGCSKDDRRRCAVAAPGSRGGSLGQWPALRPKSVHGSCAGELRGTQAFDEVAAAHPTGLLSGSQDAVDAGETTRNPFCDNGTTGDDAVAIQQNLCCGVGANGGVGLDGRQQGPSPGGRGGTGAGGHRGPSCREPSTRQGAEAAGSAGVAARAWGCASGFVRGAAACEESPQRGKGVVADPPRPDQVPQDLCQRVVVKAGDGVGERAEEERAAAFERVKDIVVEVGEVEIFGRCRQGQVCGLGQVK